jgi:hypothetical protein
MVEPPLKVFFSYSHKDEALRDELGKHLKVLEHQGLILSWYDRKILPGEERNQRISNKLESADIILLLISSDFIASEYCWDVEVKKAMKLHEAGAACVIPVVLRSVDWSNTPFSTIQALPTNAKPVRLWNDIDEAFRSITEGIRKTGLALIEKQQQKAKQVTNYYIEEEQQLKLFVEAKFINPQDKIIAHKRETVNLTLSTLPISQECVMLNAWAACGSRFLIQLSTETKLIMEESDVIPIVGDPTLDTAHFILNQFSNNLIGIDVSPAKFHPDIWYRICVSEEGNLEYEFHIGSPGISSFKKKIKGSQKLFVV